MAINPPLTAAGHREPARPRPIPQRVRDAIKLMVYGKIDDPDCKCVSFIEAAKLCGLKPDQMRRWLDRAEVRALLLAERRVFRDALCAGNEAALARVRDESANGMCVVASVRALEQISEDAHGRGGAQASPHLTIRIVAPTPTPAPLTIEHQPVTIEAEPIKPKWDERGRRIDQNGEPCFDFDRFG